MRNVSNKIFLITFYYTQTIDPTKKLVTDQTKDKRVLTQQNAKFSRADFN